MQTKTNNLPTVFSASASKKILFATVPADGHFNPLTGLAKYLQEKGFQVAWYASADYTDRLNKLGIRHYRFNRAKEITAANIEAIYPERKNITSAAGKLNFDIINFFILRGEEYYRDMVEVRKKFSFDLVIADVAFTGIPFIKDKMKVPVVSVGVFPLTESSISLPPTGLGMTPSYSLPGQIKQFFLRFAADKILFRKANKVMRSVLKENQIAHNNTNVFDLLVKKSTLVLQSGTPGFEYFRKDLGKNIRFVGPMLPYYSGSHHWYDERVNKYEQVVLVTQGTVEKDVNKLLIPTLEAFVNSGILVIVTTGGSKTAMLRRKYPQKNFIIEDFIPFGDVMPYADVYVSNGGYGGVMLAIENQVPMVVAGVHEGKNEINARVGYFNLGIDLKTETPMPARIRGAVEQVLTEKIFKESVVKISREFSAYDTYALSLKYIKELLNEDSITKASTDYLLN